MKSQNFNRQHRLEDMKIIGFFTSLMALAGQAQLKSATDFSKLLELFLLSIERWVNDKTQFQSIQLWCDTI